MNCFIEGGLYLKSNNAIRRPSLAHSSISTDRSSNLSIGDTLRKAKSDLFFARCIYGILIALLIMAVILAYAFGYMEMLMDKFISLMQ